MAKKKPFSRAAGKPTRTPMMDAAMHTTGKAKKNGQSYPDSASRASLGADSTAVP